jgi:hypothetical protein
MPADDVLPQIVNAHEAADGPERHGFVCRSLGIIFDAVNPFDAVLELFSDHEAIVGLMVFIAAVAVVLLLIIGLWSVVQEAFVGVGPTAGAGLN